MKDLIATENIYLDEFDVNIDTYLSPSELKTIVDGALECDDLVERDVFIAMAILRLKTDISNDILDTIDIDLIFTSGLVDAINGCINNYNLIDFYINKYESIGHKVSEFLDEMVKLTNNMPDINTLTEELGKLKDVSTELSTIK